MLQQLYLTKREPLGTKFTLQICKISIIHLRAGDHGDLANERTLALTHLFYPVNNEFNDFFLTAASPQVAAKPEVKVHLC